MHGSVAVRVSVLVTTASCPRTSAPPSRAAAGRMGVREQELILRSQFLGRGGTRTLVFEYLEVYESPKRRHSTLGFLSREAQAAKERCRNATIPVDNPAIQRFPAHFPSMMQNSDFSTRIERRTISRISFSPSRNLKEVSRYRERVARQRADDILLPSEFSLCAWFSAAPVLVCLALLTPALLTPVEDREPVS